MSGTIKAMLTGPGTGRPRPSATPAPSPARLDGRHSRTPSVRACSFVRRVAGEHRALPRDIDGACAPRPPAPCPAARPCTPRPRASSSSSSLCGGPSLCSSYTQQRAAPPRGPCARADRRGGAPPAAPQAILEKVVEYFHYKVRPKSRGGGAPKEQGGVGGGRPWEPWRSSRQGVGGAGARARGCAGAAPEVFRQRQAPLRDALLYLRRSATHTRRKCPSSRSSRRCGAPRRAQHRAQRASCGRRGRAGRRALTRPPVQVALELLMASNFLDT